MHCGRSSETSTALLKRRIGRHRQHALASVDEGLDLYRRQSSSCSASLDAGVCTMSVVSTMPRCLRNLDRCALQTCDDEHTMAAWNEKRAQGVIAHEENDVVRTPVKVNKESYASSMPKVKPVNC